MCEEKSPLWRRSCLYRWLRRRELRMSFKQVCLPGWRLLAGDFFVWWHQRLFWRRWWTELPYVGILNTLPYLTYLRIQCDWNIILFLKRMFSVRRNFPLLQQLNLTGLDAFSFGANFLITGTISLVSGQNTNKFRALTVNHWIQFFEKLPKRSRYLNPHKREP